MSKKIVKSKVKKDSVEIEPEVVNSNNVSKKEFQLINFDIPTKIFLGTCLVLYILAVIFKIHGSSIPIWNQLLSADGVPKKTGLIWGKPQSIRSDEWAIQTPFIISQSTLGFPESNEALGASKSPLIMNMPVKGITMILKPQMWGFLFLDIERAYSYYWNFRVFGLLAGFFLILMIFTKSNFWLSLLGSIWLFLAGGIQWWFSTLLVELLVCFCFVVVSSLYIVFSKNLLKMVTWSLVFICFTFMFVSLLYPPWQIPISYLGLILFGCFVTANFNEVKPFLGYKLATLAISTMVIISFLYLFYSNAKETIDLITNTVYPGKRTIKGGNLIPSKFFAEYFSVFLREDHVPTLWDNICEVSTVIFFFPILIWGIVDNFISKRKDDIISLSLLGYSIFCLIWMFIELPPFVGIVTLFKRVTTYRLLVIFGIINIILTILYLNQAFKLNKKKTLKENGIFIIISFIFNYIVLSITNGEINNFFSTSQLLTSVFLFTLLYTLLFNANYKISIITFAIIIIGITLPNTKANPISVGLSPIINHPLNKAVFKIVASDPLPKWAVYGNFTVSNFIKITGANVFTGSKWVPNLPEMHKLDNLQKYDSVYNRYGYVTFMPYINNDSIIFHYNQQDLYTIGIDPCSAKMKDLQIKYVVFAYQPQQAETRCMELISDYPLPIYKIR